MTTPKATAEERQASLVERLKEHADGIERTGFRTESMKLLRLAAAEIERMRDALERYGEHEMNCDLHYWEAGEQREDGYYNKYRGKWYRYSDQAPPCSCGLHAALARKEADRE